MCHSDVIRNDPEFIFVDINECSSSPCGNHGTCTDTVNGYRCTCTAGFTGESCQTSKSIIHIYACTFDQQVILYLSCLPSYEKMVLRVCVHRFDR